MDAYIDNVTMLVYQPYHLLVAIARRNAYKPCEFAYSEVYMNYKIAWLHLLKLFHCQGHFTSTSLFRAKTILMKTIEYLVVCKETSMQLMVNKAFVQRLSNRFKRNIGSYRTAGNTWLGIKDFSQTLVLLLAIGQDVEFISLKKIVFKRLNQQIEILMEQWLGRYIKF